MSDLVSVIMPNYNGAKFIEDAIRSVQEQTYSNWELIIVDDCSSDDSLSLIHNLKKFDNRIRLYSHTENQGQANSRNKAIKEAKGRYIAFLDSDDLWLPKKLESQINFMRKNQADFSYTAYSRITENNQLIHNFPVKNLVTYKQLLKQNTIGCLTVIYDSKNLGKHYFLETTFSLHEDFHIWLQILKSCRYGYGLNIPLAKYREHNNCNSSVSGNKFKSIFRNWKLYRQVERLPIHKSIYYFCIFGVNSILKYSNITFYKLKNRLKN